jgi:hypothetical protein
MSRAALLRAPGYRSLSCVEMVYWKIHPVPWPGFVYYGDALLPGLAQFDESIIDKFEAGGWKLLRNRVTTLRLWLQLWDSQNGHIVWESSGEVTVSTVFLSPKQTVALEEIAKKLLARMIQGGLLGSTTENKTTEED